VLNFSSITEILDFKTKPAASYSQGKIKKCESDGQKLNLQDKM
jgi:hypothetical protein